MICNHCKQDHGLGVLPYWCFHCRRRACSKHCAICPKRPRKHVSRLGQPPLDALAKPEIIRADSEALLRREREQRPLLNAIGAVQILREATTDDDRRQTVERALSLLESL